MFKVLTDAVENILDIVTSPLYGDLPTQRQVAQLVADGLTIYAISEATGIAVGILGEILGEDV